MESTASATPAEMREHYERRYREEDRLRSPQGRLEFLRTMEIIGRYLPPPPARVLDVGGAGGVYAVPLSEAGYEVHLIDPMPRHIEVAKAASAGASAPLASVQQGDARELPYAGASCDAVLLLGPLYHLTARADRDGALSEVKRVLRPSRPLFAAAISRFASTFDGIARGFIAEPGFERIAERDVREGQHRNPTERPEWFTTAFFHHPDELRDEVIAAGFEDVEVLAVEGPGWVASNLAALLDVERPRRALLDAIRRVESERSILGASPHLLAAARSPSHSSA